VKTPPVYYSKDLLKTAEQIEAAHLLLSTLLARRMADGQRLSYLARRWGRNQRGINAAAEQARVELAYRERGVPQEKRHFWIPDPVPLTKLVNHRETFLPMLDDMEMEACLALDDPRTEALIRGMFTSDPPALYFTKEAPRTAKAKTAPKRAPGRPKGAKNKPKSDDRNDEGWLMPDGRRVML
jgi:hypothetical protein